MKWITHDRPKFVERKNHYTFLIFLSLFFTYSCGNKKEEWLKEYAITKCTYVTKVNQRDGLIANATATLLSEKEQTLSEFKAYAEKYQVHFDVLNQQIQWAKDDYVKKYKEESDKQNSIHPHPSKQQYEKTIKALQEKRDQEISDDRDEINKFQTLQANDATYIQYTIKLADIDKTIGETEEKIKIDFKSSIDSLQNLMNKQDENFKTIVSSLHGEELKKFTTQRDSLVNNPCKK
jgi:hypothetical protein